MTKHFCDICGKPALDMMPEIKLQLPTLMWVGEKMSQGSCVGGMWKPVVSARIICETHDMQHAANDDKPDLCASCVCVLLDKMRNRLLETPKQ